jgi:hypothetical protein
MTVMDASRYLDLSKPRILAFVQSGRIEAEKRLGVWFIDRKSVHRFSRLKRHCGRPKNPRKSKRKTTQNISMLDYQEVFRGRIL